MNNIPDYHRATNMAYAVLQALNISTLPVTIFSAIKSFPLLRVVPYSKVCFRYGLSWPDYMRLSVSDRGYICRKGRKAIIYYNDTVDAEITRFTLAHELGHYVLRHTEETTVTDKEANCFARNFLCPVPVTDYFALNDVGDCCDIFYVTPPAAEVVLDKRFVDRKNTDFALYQNMVKLFNLKHLTKEEQIKRFPTRAMRAFSDFTSDRTPHLLRRKEPLPFSGSTAHKKIFNGYPFDWDSVIGL